MICCADGMQRVALTLPPPGRLSGAFPGSDQLSPTTEKALGRLLAACGLENHYGGLCCIMSLISDPGNPKP